MTSIYGKIFLAEVWLNLAEQMSLDNFIILREKRDSNTGIFMWNLWNFQGQWFLLLKTCNLLLCNKKYIRHKLAIFSIILFILLYLLLTWWWDIRLKHDMAWLWEEQAESRNVCLKWKEVLLLLYHVDKNWNENISIAHVLLYW